MDTSGSPNDHARILPTRSDPSGTDSHQVALTVSNNVHAPLDRQNSNGVSNGISHRERRRSHNAAHGYQDNVTLVFNDVCVTLNKNNILKKVYGMAKVGQMLAVMGPSGAGKSTLLNTLTGRVPVTSGSVTLNDVPVDRRLRRKISYVMQQDVFYPNLTLRETLLFQTLLRLPGSMPLDLKVARMNEIVAALELNKCLDTRMGSTFVTGLSGGEKKRASIACELLTNPKLLILDEPTSGLDSAIAYSLMSSLDKYAKLSRKTVVTTIHQPSSQIFHMFTNILLLSDGQVAYFGAGSKIVQFFAGVGLHCAPHYNPADFILEELKYSSENAQTLIEAAYQLRYRDDWPAELRSKTTENNGNANHHHHHHHVVVVGGGELNEAYVVSRGDLSSVNLNEPDDALSAANGYVSATTSNVKSNIATNWRKSGEFQHVSDEVTLKAAKQRNVSEMQQQQDGVTSEVDVEAYMDPEAVWQTGFWSQYATLTRRNLLSQKGRYLSKLNFSRVLFMAVFAGLMWFRTERTEETARDRLGILFFVATHFAFLPAMEVVGALTDDTGVFSRERSAGLYRLSAYYLAVTTTEIPVAFALTTLYVVVNYWMTNLMPGAVNFIAHWLILVLSTFTAQSFGMLVSVLITSRPFVMSFANAFIIATFLAGGFYNTHISFWFKWIRYLSFLTYTLNALSKTEFAYGSPLLCNPNNTAFPQQCTANSTSIDGTVFLSYWDLNFTPMYADILALVIATIVCRILTYIVLRYLRRPKT